MLQSLVRTFCLVTLAGLGANTVAAVERTLSSEDLFELQYASEVRLSPDGGRVVYVRSIHDIMCDCVRSNLWTVDTDGDNHRPLLSGRGSYSSPRFSPKTASASPSSAMITRAASTR